MGIYIFSWKLLRKMLVADMKDPDSAHDFGKNIIPQMLADGRTLLAYEFKGYWKDVGTIDLSGKRTWIFWTRKMNWILGLIPGRFTPRMSRPSRLTSARRLRQTVSTSRRAASAAGRLPNRYVYKLEGRGRRDSHRLCPHAGGCG